MREGELALPRGVQAADPGTTVELLRLWLIRDTLSLSMRPVLEDPAEFGAALGEVALNAARMYAQRNGADELQMRKALIGAFSDVLSSGGRPAEIERKQQ